MVAVLFRTLDVLRIYDLPAILTGGGGGPATRPRRCPSSSSPRSGRASTAPSALSTLVFLLIAFVAWIFMKFLGADVVQRPPGPKGKRQWFRRAQPPPPPKGAEP